MRTLTHQAARWFLVVSLMCSSWWEARAHFVGAHAQCPHPLDAPVALFCMSSVLSDAARLRVTDHARLSLTVPTLALLPTRPGGCSLRPAWESKRPLIPTSTWTALWGPSRSRPSSRRPSRSPPRRSRRATRPAGSITFRSRPRDRTARRQSRQTAARRKRPRQRAGQRGGRSLTRVAAPPSVPEGRGAARGRSWSPRCIRARPV